LTTPLQDACHCKICASITADASPTLRMRAEECLLVIVADGA
jgi:hypothetical protein